jgi:hypothetical protein
VDTIIINFQDNDLTPHKMAMLDQACARTQAKTLVLRNLTYFIEVPELPQAFPLMRSKRHVDFKFIWEKYLLVSEHEAKEDEHRKLLSDDAWCYLHIDFRNKVIDWSIRYKVIIAYDGGSTSFLAGGLRSISLLPALDHLFDELIALVHAGEEFLLESIGAIAGRRANLEHVV